MAPVAAALAVGLVLAGCTGSAPSEPPAPTASDGHIGGVVVDAAIRPLAGAVATIPAAPGAGSATTGEDGMFRFTGLRPGLHVVHVAKPGYLSATLQATASTDPEAPLAKVVLEALAETRPYVVLESFDGLIECGVGSGLFFGLSTGCLQTTGAALAVACSGSDPVPPTGICLDQAPAYYHPEASGNLTMAQSELTWEPTLDGAELLLLAYVFDEARQVVGGAGYATGPPFLVVPIGRDLVAEHDLGGANHVGLYVAAGPGQSVNVVAQQPFRAFHSTAYHFELPSGWAYVRDGAPLVPPVCTTCLAP